MSGLIALDIDGTITSEASRIPDQVVERLEFLSNQGWRIALLTGRTLSFAQPLLNQLRFPYFLALQNGADILKMPSQELLRRTYLSSSLIPRLEKAYQGYPEDFIIYSGFEKGDFCYFRPDKFSESLLIYFYELKEHAKAPWVALKEFSFSSEEKFPLIKCLGSESSMLSVSNQLQTLEEVAVSVIRDPLSVDLYLNLVTDKRANKGEALKFLLESYPTSFVIAAGDDRNDIPMLRQANERIVMETAPEMVKKEATIHAKSARKLGILKALEEAISRARQ